jgi:predicted exporter
LQFVTPFPGLQQMAIFCAAGIAGAWLTVLALAPYYRPALGARHSEETHRTGMGPASAPLVAAALFYRIGERLYRPLWMHPRAVGTGLAVALLVAAISIQRGGINDAVTNLNTSPAALMASEHQVQVILQQPSVSRFLVVTAATPEQLLVRSQALEKRLVRSNEANTDDPPLRWQALHQYLPPARQQQDDRQLVAATLYGPGGALALLCQKLGTRCAEPVLPGTELTAEVLEGEVAKFLPPLLERQGQYYSLVTLSGGGSDTQLAAALAPLPGVKLVNQTSDLSSLLGRYRVNVSKLLGVTLVLLAIGLALRYRRRGWRMLVPLVIAMLLALGCAAVEGITLFHTMALLLVIGIGLDTAVFYTEVGFNAESWLASSLACVTSILAFGLLSLSAVPVLHQFGIVILSGILGAWLLTPLFFAPDPEKRKLL